MSFRTRENRILTSLRKGEIPLGMEVNTGDPSIIEILGYTGFDFCMLDMEHSRMSRETMENCIRAADAAGITAIVRVTQNDAGLIRQVQEAGAQGVVVPHVETTADLQKVIDAVRYAPEGKCGVCPSVRAANYSTEDYEKYIEYCNQNTMIIPLLEDRNGFENAKEIFDMLKPEVDAIGTGMGDLAFSLTKPGHKVDRQHPYIKEAAAKVAELSRQTGVPIMDMAFSPESARDTIARGTRILLYSIDQLVFHDLCRDIVRAVKG
jgi:2-keto-3-deoxy-L-rhamnonate aldolase RhmA